MPPSQNTKLDKINPKLKRVLPKGKPSKSTQQLPKSHRNIICTTRAVRLNRFSIRCQGNLQHPISLLPISTCQKHPIQKTSNTKHSKLKLPSQSNEATSSTAAHSQTTLYSSIKQDAQSKQNKQSSQPAGIPCSDLLEPQRINPP